MPKKIAASPQFPSKKPSKTSAKMSNEFAQKRLHVFLAEAGIASRRGAEKLILEGQVKVNGRKVQELGTKINPDKDLVLFKNRKVSPEKKVLYAFYKPKNVVTTMSDPQGRPTVAEYLSNVPERVFPVGRLDRDVTGLLLFTNDGEYADKLLHPRYRVPRTYLAVVEGQPDKKVLDKLCTKVRLIDGNAKAESASLKGLDAKTKKLFGLIPKTHSVIELSVAEGRKHFVKKILRAVGFPVVKLARISFGPYSLGQLRAGEIRVLHFQDLT